MTESSQEDVYVEVRPVFAFPQTTFQSPKKPPALDLVRIQSSPCLKLPQVKTADVVSARKTLRFDVSSSSLLGSFRAPKHYRNTPHKPQPSVTSASVHSSYQKAAEFAIKRLKMQTPSKSKMPPIDPRKLNCKDMSEKLLELSEFVETRSSQWQHSMSNVSPLCQTFRESEEDVSPLRVDYANEFAEEVSMSELTGQQHFKLVSPIDQNALRRTLKPSRSKNETSSHYLWQQFHSSLQNDESD